MENLKPNDVLVNKEGGEITILATNGDSVGVWVTDKKSPWTTTLNNLINNGWTKKKTPWMPEINKRHFVASIITPGLFFACTWRNDETDHHRLALGLVFETEAEAVERAKEIIELMKK